MDTRLDRQAPEESLHEDEAGDEFGRPLSRQADGPYRAAAVLLPRAVLRPKGQLLPLRLEETCLGDTVVFDNRGLFVAPEPEHATTMDRIVARAKADPLRAAAVLGGAGAVLLGCLLIMALGTDAWGMTLLLFFCGALLVAASGPSLLVDRNRVALDVAERANLTRRAVDAHEWMILAGNAPRRALSALARGDKRGAQSALAYPHPHPAADFRPSGRYALTEQLAVRLYVAWVCGMPWPLQMHPDWVLQHFRSIGGSWGGIALVGQFLGDAERARALALEELDKPASGELQILMPKLWEWMQSERLV